MTLALTLLAGWGVVHLSGSDPMLEEIELYAAEENEYAAALKQQLAAIRKGQSVNVSNDEGYTPLMNAVLSGDLKAVDYLLVKGARLHRPGQDKRTAAEMAHHEKIRELLEACALAERRPNDLEREQMRQSLRNAHINPDNLNQALFDAISSWRGNSVTLTAQVLALGANANAVNQEGRHILQQRHQDPGTMVLLLRQGSDPNAARDSQGASHAVLNTIKRDARFVQALLTAKAEVKGANALAKAAGEGNASLVRQFLEHGANPNGVADNGKTVLEHAVQGLGNPAGHDELAGIPRCVKLLLAAGAKTEYTPKDGPPRSPLSPGGMSILPECIRLLVDAGADVNATNSRGANYAHIAAYKEPTRKNLELLEDIIDAGADLKKADTKGETLLFYALPGLCALPVADPDEKIREEAIELLEDYLKIIKSANPDPAARDRNGNTALHLAVIRRGTADDRVVEFLLRMGVDPSVRNKFGRTALEAMLRNPCGPRSKYIARLLASKGPMPTDPGLQLVQAAMTDDTTTIRKLLEAKPERDILATALGCVQNAAAADILLRAGAPCQYENMAYMVRHGNPDVVRIFVNHRKLEYLAPHWASVRTEAMAKAFVEAGLMPGAPQEIANEKVLRYLLTVKGFNPNGTKISLSAWRDGEAILPYMAANGRSKMTRLLLEHGTAVNGYAVAPLALAKDIDIAEMLINAGTDLTWRSATGDTLLSYHKAKLKQLAKAYLNSPTDTELEAFRAHHAIVEMLADAGVSDVHPRKEEIKEELRQLHTDEKYETVEFVTNGWSGPVRINEEAMVMARASGNTDTANILSIGPDRIKFKWDRWGYGYAVRRADGKFHEAVDEDRYRDLANAPEKVPSYQLTFTNEQGRETRLYLHPDYQYAVRGDTKAGGKVIELKRGCSGAFIRIKWDKGGETRLVKLGDKVCVLNPETARQVLKENRPTIAFTEISVVGDSWQDRLRISTEFMVAARSGGSRDTARVLLFDNNRLALKWDRWGEESFIRQADGKFHKDNSKLIEGERIRNLIRQRSREIRTKNFRFAGPGWQDTVFISFEHKVAVRSGGRKDAATVIRFDKNSITLKWDKYGEETFIRQPDGLFKVNK